MPEANLTLRGTETRGGFTVIWTEEGVAIVYDMKGNANQVTREYCSCGKEPCVHQRAAFELEAAPTRAHQTRQEPRREASQPDVVYHTAPSERGSEIKLSLPQALLVYPLACVVEWAGLKVLKLAGMK